MTSNQLSICMQQKNRLIHTYALLGMGMGIALMIVFSSIALLPMTELIEIAGIMLSVYLSTGLIIYYHLESKLKKAKENALLFAVCQKIQADFQPHLSDAQLLRQLKKMMQGYLSRPMRLKLLENYLKNEAALEKLSLSLIQNQAEVDLLMTLGLRWDVQKKSKLGFHA